MEKKNYRWHGCDMNNSVSLFEQGFIMRDISGTESSEVVFISGVDTETENGGYVYSYGEFSYDTWKKECLDNKGTNRFPNIKGIAEMSGIEEDEYFNSVDKTGFLSDLIQYYGEEEILGTHFVTYTEKEIRRKLGRALPK